VEKTPKDGIARRSPDLSLRVFLPPEARVTNVRLVLTTIGQLHQYLIAKIPPVANY
jgi:hypothetical protein